MIAFATVQIGVDPGGVGALNILGDLVGAGPVAALFVLYQTELTAWVTGRSPGMTGEALDDRITAAIMEGIVVHALLFVVYLAAAWSTRTRASRQGSSGCAPTCSKRPSGAPAASSNSARRWRTK